MSCKLAYCERGNPSLPSLILLHGFLGSKEDWTEVMARLETYYHCIAVDLPGHGESLMDDDISVYTMDGAACELLTLMHSLRVKPATLLAYSMGGRLAYHLLASHHEYFSKAYIESSRPGILEAKLRLERLSQDQEMAKRLEAMHFENFLEMWYAKDIFKSLAFKTEQRARMFERRRKNSPQHLARALRLMSVGNQKPVWKDLKKLTVSLTLVTGESDIKYRDIADEVVKTYWGAKQITLPGVGHTVHIENVDAFCEILIKEIS